MPAPLDPLRLEVAALAASPLPLGLSLAKLHSAVDSADFDALLPVYVMAAIGWAEDFTHRTIYARSHTWVLRDFPRDARGEILPPRGKTQSVESVSYVSNGATVTLTGPSAGSPAGADYQEDLRGDGGGVIMPARGASWPSVDFDAPAPVVIRFTAGWLAGEIPDAVTQALLFTVDDFFELRGTADLAPGASFRARQALLSAYMLTRVYG